MQINASFDFAADTPQAERNNFVNAVNTVVGYFDTLFTNANVTLNVKFALGEDYLSDNGTTISYQRMANINAPGSLLGSSFTPYEIRDYTTVRNLLLTKTDTLQPTAYATLPTNSPFGTEKLVVSTAEQKALGITPTRSVAGYDGVIGIISEQELAPGGNTADWTKSAPVAGQYYMIGAIEHELTEVMGRFAFDGTSPFGAGVGPVYTIMDLFRYSSPGVRQTTNGDPAYFSIDNGNHFYYYWNTPARAPGDLGDWTQFVPSGTPPGADSFDLNENSGVINEVSAFDLNLMNVVGWNLVPVAQPNPPPPAATTADMILRHGADGQYEIYDIGNNAILAGYFLGQVGTTWQFAGLGGFVGTDTTDMLLRNSNTGGFEVYDISNNNITNAAFLGNVGLDWQVMGFGNFSSMPGETDMILRNSNTGGVEVYDISNNQITGAAFMGAVGLNWQFSGVGNFSGRGTSDMLLRDSNSGGLEVYDINNNQITGAAFIGAVGTNWQFSGVGNFSGVPGETDLLLRNNNTGGLELYDINGNQLTGAAFIGTVGLDWQFAGIAPAHGPGTSDLVLRNANTGQFEVYDISNNQLTGAALLGQVGLDWQLGGFAVDPPTAAMGSSSQVGQLVQAMAGFGGGGGAAESLNAAALGADTSQQPLLTTPQHA